MNTGEEAAGPSETEPSVKWSKKLGEYIYADVKITQHAETFDLELDGQKFVTRGGVDVEFRKNQPPTVIVRLAAHKVTME